MTSYLVEAIVFASLNVKLIHGRHKEASLPLSPYAWYCLSVSICYVVRKQQAKSLFSFVVYLCRFQEQNEAQSSSKIETDIKENHSLL